MLIFWDIIGKPLVTLFLDVWEEKFSFPPYRLSWSLVTALGDADSGRGIPKREKAGGHLPFSMTMSK